MKKFLLAGLVFATMSSAALAAEPLTNDRLDAVTAGDGGVAVAAFAVGAGAAGAQAGNQCSGGCSITDGVTTVFVGHGTLNFAQALGS